MPRRLPVLNASRPPDPEEQLAIARTSAGAFAAAVRNEHSQYGEDGLLEALFERLGIQGGFGVEFGAWDGIVASNMFNLISNHGWHGVLIEGSDAKFAELERNMAGYEGVTSVHAMVGWDGPTSLDRLLEEAGAPAEFDLLSIDIDGNDYHVWAAFQDFRPKAVIVEYNPTVPNHVEFVQERSPAVNHGSGLRSLAGLAHEKGYVPVGVTLNNVVFLREDLAAQHGIPSPPLDELRPWRLAETSLIHLYDGTVVIHGLSFGPWNSVELRRGGVQTVPAFLRGFPTDEMAAWRRGLLRALRVWRRLRARGS
jgi:hypothetical protein